MICANFVESFVQKFITIQHGSKLLAEVQLSIILLHTFFHISNTVPIDKILSVKIAGAWVSMASHLKKNDNENITEKLKSLEPFRS